ncbi:MAG: HAD-IIB family hydrolase [Planctomycetales bacterium]|nr:HAD-IIB family hydrolase [Planctomycetales bacterium]
MTSVLQKPAVLATDLDGTFLPLEGNVQNAADLPILEDELQQAAMMLAYVTGRHFASVAAVMERLHLPHPEWIVCDVGSSIYQRTPTGYTLSREYSDHLAQIVGDFSTGELARVLADVRALRQQEAEKQSRFKLSYYVESGQLEGCLEIAGQRLEEHQAPYSVVASVDPFNGDGLVDFLPTDVSKAYALNWWAGLSGFAREEILFAGDSGNDSAALAAGYRAIIVANAAPEVVAAARQAHQREGWENRLFTAAAPATSGVLAGVRHFLNRH